MRPIGTCGVQAGACFAKCGVQHFVGIARGSAAEVSYQLLLAKDLGYISPERYGELRSSYDRVGQMLTRLSQSLNHE